MKYVLVFFMIAACNKSTNPSETYKDVPTVPKHDQPAPQQEYAASPFSIQIPSPVTAANPQFNEGLEGQVRFQVSHDPRITDYSLEVLEGPQGGKLTPAPEGKDLYDFRWTPPQRFISEGFSRVVNLVLIAKAREVTEPRLASASQPTPFSLVVTRGNIAPRIIGVNSLSNDIGSLTKLEGGKVYPFTVIVEDKLATPGRILVEAKPCGQFFRRDRPQFDGNDYVSETGINEVSNGRFEAKMQIDLESKPLPVRRAENPQDSLTEGVDLCFDLYAFNQDTGLTSAAVRRVVSSLYKPKTPLITLDDRPKTVRAGKVAYLDFSVDAGVEFGELSVTADLESFPGERTFECVPFKQKDKDVPGRFNCTFQWIVPDEESSLGKVYFLKIKATHNVIRNGKTLAVTESATTSFHVEKIEIAKKAKQK